MEVPRFKLNTGNEIPAIGFGTWQLAAGDHAQSAVTQAITAGYRLLDTARIYNNEKSVGQAIKNSDIKRQNLFVTTKLWPQDFGYQNSIKAFNSSLELLGLDYLDLYLIHWPAGSKRKQAWRALVEIFEQGHSKAIGVSNYMVEHLQEVISDLLVPAVNQIEFHPFIYERQKPVLEMCHRYKILVEAYSPLTVGRNINHPLISQIAAHNNRSNAQIILRWCVQHGTVPLPRSSNPHHIKQNLDIFNFQLSPEDMTSLDNLSQNSSWNPNTM